MPRRGCLGLSIVPRFPELLSPAREQTGLP